MKQPFRQAVALAVVWLILLVPAGCGLQEHTSESLPSSPESTVLPITTATPAATSTTETTVATTATTATPSPTTVATTVATETVHHTMGDFEREMLALINQYRRKAGLQELYYDDSLYVCAYTRAVEISYCFSHTRPNGEPFTSVLAEKNVPFDAIVNENIAAFFNDPKKTMDRFMASEPHRKNILYPDFTRVCIALYESETYPGYYAIEQFFMGAKGSY